MSLSLIPMTLREARAFVDEHHRHHRAPQGGLWAIGAAGGEEVIGVAIVGKPVSKALDDDYTAEVRRVAVIEGNPNACSMLYAACWRAGRAMGYRRLITYTLKSEPGTSLIAAGWRIVGEVKGRSWHTPSRPRVDNASDRGQAAMGGGMTDHEHRWERHVGGPVIVEAVTSVDEDGARVGDTVWPIETRCRCGAKPTAEAISPAALQRMRDEEEL